MSLFDVRLRLCRDGSLPCPTSTRGSAVVPSGPQPPPTPFELAAARTLRLDALQDVPNFAVRWRAATGSVHALLRGLVARLNDAVWEYKGSEEYAERYGRPASSGSGGGSGGKGDGGPLAAWKWDADNRQVRLSSPCLNALSPAPT